MMYKCLRCGAIETRPATANDTTTITYMLRCEHCRANGY